jgi:hypothetical protein
MKRHHHLVLFLLGCLFFAACDSNPAWVGPKGEGKADKLAAETCKCLYEMVGSEAGWDRDAILEEVKKIRKGTKRNLQDAVLESENPAVVKALSGEEDFSMKMDECECMEPVQDLLLEQGVAFEEMMGRLDQHCLLGAFYN